MHHYICPEQTFDKPRLLCFCVSTQQQAKRLVKRL